MSRFALLPLSILVCASACKRDRIPETVPEDVLDRAEQGESAAKRQARQQAQAVAAQAPSLTTEKTAAPEPLPPSPPDGEQFPDDVRPPQDGDLSRYIADLGEEGALVAVIATTKGTVNCKLHADEAPLAVANFIGLARGMKPFLDPATGETTRRRYYDGLIFHRVIPNFMIQGGDPLGTGLGGPGYKFKNEIHQGLTHDRGGVLAMANAGPDTNGSQFYITESGQSFLDGKYTVFGQCNGVEVVRTIARVPRDARDKPNTPVMIRRVEIKRQ